MCDRADTLSNKEAVSSEVLSGDENETKRSGDAFISSLYYCDDDDDLFFIEISPQHLNLDSF